MAKLPHNLQSIHDKVTGCYPGIVIGEIAGNTHTQTHTDHLPDSRGLVHALDLMFENDTNFHHGAPATLAWLLTPGVRNSLEYFIHDETIYSVNNNPPFSAEQYRGSDPHTNHIHVSGKHGSTGYTAQIGNGYDAAAEKLTPTGSPCTTSHPSAPVAPPEEDMPLTKADIDLLLASQVGNSGLTVGICLDRASKAATPTSMQSMEIGASNTTAGVMWDRTYNDVETLKGQMTQVLAALAALTPPPAS